MHFRISEKLIPTHPNQTNVEHVRKQRFQCQGLWIETRSLVEQWLQEVAGRSWEGLQDLGWGTNQ